MGMTSDTMAAPDWIQLDMADSLKLTFDIMEGWNDNSAAINEKERKVDESDGAPYLGVHAIQPVGSIVAG